MQGVNFLDVLIGKNNRQNAENTRLHFSGQNDIFSDFFFPIFPLTPSLIRTYNKRSYVCFRFGPWREHLLEIPRISSICHMNIIQKKSQKKNKAKNRNCSTCMILSAHRLLHTGTGLTCCIVLVLLHGNINLSLSLSLLSFSLHARATRVHYVSLTMADSVSDTARGSVTMGRW